MNPDLTLLERVAALELAASANVALDRLPLGPLQRKLETAWQPSASVLLQPGSVTSDVLAPPEVYALALTNGWAVHASFPNPRAFRLGAAVSIVATLNSVSASSVTAFTLPPGFRPPSLVGAGTVFWTGAVYQAGSCYVFPSGAVQLYGNNAALVGSVDYLVNVTFMATS